MSELPMRLSQVSVPLPSELRRWLEARAQAEDRSLAGEIRHLIAAAQRAQAGSGRGRGRDLNRDGVAA